MRQLRGLRKGQRFFVITQTQRMGPYTAAFTGDEKLEFLSLVNGEGPQVLCKDAAGLVVLGGERLVQVEGEGRRYRTEDVASRYQPQPRPQTQPTVPWDPTTIYTGCDFGTTAATTGPRVTRIRYKGSW